MSKTEWPTNLVHIIAGEVRRYRRKRKISVRELSDALTRRGLAMPAPVLSNFELKRRDTISVAELLALAAELRVPPLLLVFPLGRVEALEILPGTEVSPWDGALWATGARQLPDVEKWGDDAETVRTFQLHQQHVNHALEIRREAQREDRKFDPNSPIDLPRMSPQDLRARASRADFELRYVRDHIRRADLIPPALPAELAHIDDPDFHPTQLAAAE